LPVHEGLGKSTFETKSLALVATGRDKEADENELSNELSNELLNDGLMVSAAPVKVIELPLRREATRVCDEVEILPSFAAMPPGQLDWLSQPLSGRSLAWTIIRSRFWRRYCCLRWSFSR
jgi:hypothetical protein